MPIETWDSNDLQLVATTDNLCQRPACLRVWSIVIRAYLCCSAKHNEIVDLPPSVSVPRPNYTWEGQRDIRLQDPFSFDNFVPVLSQEFAEHSAFVRQHCQLANLDSRQHADGSVKGALLANWWHQPERAASMNQLDSAVPLETISVWMHLISLLGHPRSCIAKTIAMRITALIAMKKPTSRITLATSALPIANCLEAL
jgi:hypothetical protein